MAVENFFAGVQSLEDALLSLQGGQHFVVCSPQRDLSLDLLRITLARLPKNKSALLSFSPIESGILQKTPGALVNLASEDSATNALQYLKTSFAKIPADSFLVVNVAENHPAFFSSVERQTQLIKAIRTLATAKQCRAIWFVRRHAFLADALASLKESSDYFLQITRTGSAMFAQIIHARHAIDESLFVPRVLTLTSSAARLSTPTIAAADDASLDLVEQQYRHFFQSASEPMVVFELWGLRPRRGEYHELNHRAKDALGYDDGELVNLKVFNCIIAEKRRAAIRDLLILKKKGRHAFATQVQRKNGRIVDVEVSASALGKNLFVAIANDISERVQNAAASRALAAEYDSFVASLPYPYAIFVNRKLSVKNVAFDSLFPFVQATSPSVTDFFGRRNADLLKEVGAMVEATTPETAIRHREVLVPAPQRGRGPEKQLVSTEVSISPIQYDGKKALYCTFVDVSARRNILGRAEATEEKFKALLEQSLDAISIVHDENLMLVNAKCAEMFGYAGAMELLGKPITTVIARGNVRSETLQRLSDVLAGNDSEARFEYIGVKSDGTKIAVEARASRITMEGNQALLIYHRDVSARKRAEQDFERKEKSLTILNRISDEISGSSSLSDIWHRGLNAAMRVLQFECGAMLQVDRPTATLSIALHHNVSENVQLKLKSQSLDEGFARYFNKTHEPVVVTMADYPAHLPYKSLFETEHYTALAFLPLVVNASLHGVVMLATTRERALDDDDRTLLASLGRQLSVAVEKAMLLDTARDAETKLAATVENISDVLYTLQPNGTFEYISPNIGKLIGFKPGDFTANANLWRTLLHPDDRPILSQRISNQTHATNEFQLEYRILPKGRATYLWLRDSVRYKRSADSAIVAIEGILTDITAQKSLAKTNSLTPSAPTTARAEDDANESEAMLRNVINTMGDALMISDLSGQVWEVNREFTRLTGYSRAEARECEFPYPWLYEGEVTPFVRWMTDLLEKKHLHDLDMTWLHKTGNHIAVSQNMTLLMQAHDEPMAVLHIARDISERQKLAVELEWKSKQMQAINRIIGFANTTSNLEKIFQTIALEVYGLIAFDGIAIMREKDEALTFLAVPADDGGFRPVKSLPLDEDAIRTAVAAKQLAMKEGSGATPAQLSIPIFVSGEMYGVFSLVRNGIGSFLPDEINFLQPIADEVGAIIQRLRLLQQVNDDSEYIHNFLNSIDSVVFTVDKDYRITDMNEAFHEFIVRMGLADLAKNGPIIGKSLRLIVPDESLWRHYERVMEDLFARRIEYYSGNVEAGEGKLRVAYHLVVNPMVIHDKVTALVFTHTDITEINRTEAEIRQRNKELIALNAISTSISHSLQLDEVLRVAADQIRETFAAEAVTFYLLDEEQRTLVLSGYAGISEPLARTLLLLDPAKTLSGKVMESRKPMFVQDIGGDLTIEAERRTIAHLVNAASAAIIPLQLKGRVSGALTVGFRERREFSDKEQQLLVLVGSQLSGAIENAQLYSEIHQQVETLKTLFELTKGLTGVLDLNSVLQVVYREVMKAIPLDRFYYQAYVAEQQTLSLLSRTVNGVPEFYPQGVKVRSLQDWPNTIYQDVVATGKAYLGCTSATSNDSMIAVPIKADDNVIGIISTVSSSPSVHTQAHLRLLESIATLTGIAIGKATLYEDTLRTSSEIERRNKELDDFTYVVSHDLKEPLISIEGYSIIVMKDYGDRLDAEGRDYLGAVVQSTTRMKHLIEDLLTLSRIGRMQEPYETVSVRKVVDEILYDLQWSLKEKNVAVTVADDLPKVRYNGTRLSMVFRNLIANAMKFNDKPHPTIDIGVREEESEFVLHIADNGIGIESQYFDRIFTIFQRLKRSEEYRGTGAGLTITKRIVEREGGRIWVESEPGKGSTFYFTIRKPT